MFYFSLSGSYDCSSPLGLTVYFNDGHFYMPTLHCFIIHNSLKQTLALLKQLPFPLPTIK